MSETEEAEVSETAGIVAEARSALGTGNDKSVRIIPQAGVAGTALTAVIAVMCYLGSLALGAVIVINKSVDNWTSDISGQVTVQIRPMRAGILNKTSTKL